MKVFLKKKKKKIDSRVARFENYEKSPPLKLVFVHCSLILDCIHKYEIIVLLKAMKFDKLTLNLAPPPSPMFKSQLCSCLEGWFTEDSCIINYNLINSCNQANMTFSFLFCSFFFFNLCLSRCESFILLSNKLDLGIGSFEEIVFG